MTRRDLLAAGGLCLLSGGLPGAIGSDERPTRVNDIHSRLNPTDVRRVWRGADRDRLREQIAEAARRNLPVCVAGGRHAMGGQQFATGGLLLDMRGLDRVLSLDEQRGLVTVESGIQWPQLIRELHALQPENAPIWTIRQKQTGADDLTLGGALAANVHGRGLRMAPFVADVESFELIDADGELRRCSRDENAELFALAIGGYGLFGIITTLTLRLMRRKVLERVIDMIDVSELTNRFDERIDEGCLYGDLQYEIDPDSPGFLRRGVFCCYRPTGDDDLPTSPAPLSNEAWVRLARLAHHDKSRAFQIYAEHYRSTAGGRYASDLMQLSTYVSDYHARVDESGAIPGSEVISELFVPRGALATFMEQAGILLRKLRANVIYGTIRLIERDEVSFLAWARENYACVIFNLHVEHSPAGMRRAADAFRALIDLAQALGGSFYLTYHRHATGAQVRACHPRFEDFLSLRRKFDPQKRFQSDWARHYARLLSIE